MRDSTARVTTPEPRPDAERKILQARRQYEEARSKSDIFHNRFLQMKEGEAVKRLALERLCREHPEAALRVLPETSIPAPAPEDLVYSPPADPVPPGEPFADETEAPTGPETEQDLIPEPPTAREELEALAGELDELAPEDEAAPELDPELIVTPEIETEEEAS